MSKLKRGSTPRAKAKAAAQFTRTAANSVKKLTKHLEANPNDKVGQTKLEKVKSTGTTKPGKVYKKAS